MEINKVLEVLNKALKQNELDLWLKDEVIKDLKEENAKLKEENKKLLTGIEELKNKKDW